VYDALLKMPLLLVTLQGLVMSGALLYVFGKGAKFSLFKPAEEMVYITLDEDGRTRGKAAIDVVGSQTGKSGGSLLQQAMLLASAGSITGIMPVMFGVFFLMLRGWRAAVHELSLVSVIPVIVYVM
jgi:AAA family ATP:ADP antiporter